MDKVSKPIEDFLEYLREAEQQYHMAEAEEIESNAETQDILHSIELEDHDYHGYAKRAKELKDIRKRRREAKDTMYKIASIVEWADTNGPVIKSLEQLLGNVRKAERNCENRIYTARTKKK